MNEHKDPLPSDSGSIAKEGEPKTNDQIFFTYNQGRQWPSEKFWKGEEGIISTLFSQGYIFWQN